MGRLPVKNTQAGKPAGPGSDDEICPVCKSSRYLNPTMRFLVNPECYHKMCESCMDRIFSHGPAPCPVAGCARTLRKQRFRRATFEDLKVEREVDIRRRVAAVFNRRQEEFQDLRSWNDYLEQVETLTFNLIYNVEVKETEAKLAAYAENNKASIAQNMALERASKQTLASRLTAEREASRLSREESVRESVEQQQQRSEEIQMAQLRIAQTGETPRPAITSLKSNASGATGKGASRTTAASRSLGYTGSGPATKSSTTAVNNIFEFEGLRPVTAPAPVARYDAFGDMGIKPQYYDPAQTYSYAWLDKAKTEASITSGGYNALDYVARATFEAFAGLGVFPA